VFQFVQQAFSKITKPSPVPDVIWNVLLVLLKMYALLVLSLMKELTLNSVIALEKTIDNLAPLLVFQLAPQAIIKKKLTKVALYVMKLALTVLDPLLTNAMLAPIPIIF
jgi:hypothetical protein